ncbi:MAG: hypothetical protein EB105_04885, partial [Actinobacteria bacterium]|nr:hypothetical protein [Actinomycetota bacterium]
YPVQFFNNVLNLCKLAIANDSKIILVDYLQNHESEIERLKPGLSSGMVEIVRKMNFFFEETARKFEGNCSHIAIPNAKFYASDFTDTCHLTEIGEHKKAQIIASQLKELLD